MIGIYQYGVTLQLNNRTELDDVSISIIIAVCMLTFTSQLLLMIASASIQNTSLSVYSVQVVHETRCVHADRNVILELCVLCGIEVENACKHPHKSN